MAASGDARPTGRRRIRGFSRPTANGAAEAERQLSGRALGGPSSDAMLEVRDLKITFPTDDGLVKAVDGLSFTLERGKTLGIVGESGSGKSVTSLGILGLHHDTRAEISGSIWLDGEELISARPERV